MSARGVALAMILTGALEVVPRSLEAYRISFVPTGDTAHFAAPDRGPLAGGAGGGA